MPRRRTHTPRINGAGDPAILEVLGTDYRLWAALPANVNALMAIAPPPAIGEPSTEDKILAVVGRPTIPRGVCRKCGCTEFDPCFYPPSSVHDGSTCGWANRDQTECTLCAGLSPDAREPNQTIEIEPPRPPRRASRSSKPISRARPAAARARRSH